MSDLIRREDAIAVATSCPDSHWGPWIAERLRALPAVQPGAREAALAVVDEYLDNARACVGSPTMETVSNWLQNIRDDIAATKGGS